MVSYLSFHRRPVPSSSPTGALQASDRQFSHLDLSTLEDAVQHCFKEGLAKGTLKSYTSASWRYLAFCSLHNLAPLPISEATVCLFAAYLANAGLAPQTISVYNMAAIRHLQISSGFKAPPERVGLVCTIHCMGSTGSGLPLSNLAPDSQSQLTF